MKSSQRQKDISRDTRSAIRILHAQQKYIQCGSLSGRSMNGDANQGSLARDPGHSHQAGISLPSGDQICTLPITKRLGGNAGMRERLIRKSC
jgi:hypothetical protein